MARYIVRGRGTAGPVEFQERLTIDQALDKARQLGEAHFTHITIVNVLTGLEITDLEDLMGQPSAGGDKFASLRLRATIRDASPLRVVRCES